jgi:hypothetical protein
MPHGSWGSSRDWSQRDTDLVSWPARSRLLVCGAPEPIYLLNDVHLQHNKAEELAADNLVLGRHFLSVARCARGTQTEGAVH